MKCPVCALPATKRHAGGWLCVKHYRFRQMRVDARKSGKSVPTLDQLEELIAASGMSCNVCHTEMNWLREERPHSVLTLQHWSDGSFGFLCHRCNARQGHSPDDEFRRMPLDFKWCPKCKTWKHESNYYANANSPVLFRKIQGNCKPCRADLGRAWSSNNRARITAAQRACRARQKATNEG